MDFYNFYFLGTQAGAARIACLRACEVGRLCDTCFADIGTCLGS